MTVLRFPARRELRREVVARAAVAMLDKEGVAGLTMTGLAQRLGVSPRQLRRRVGGLRSVLSLAARAIVTGAPKPLRPTWDGALSEWARRCRRELSIHRPRAALLAAVLPRDPSVVDGAGALRSRLEELGLAAEATRELLVSLASFVADFVAEEPAAEPPDTAVSEFLFEHGLEAWLRTVATMLAYSSGTPGFS